MEVTFDEKLEESLNRIFNTLNIETLLLSGYPWIGKPEDATRESIKKELLSRLAENYDDT